MSEGGETIAERPTTESDPSTERDPLIGAVLAGRYEILDLIARGGMGRIYRAVQLQLDRSVALKILDVRHASGRRDFRRRFFLEASTAARLQHPNTIVTYDYGTTQDEVYFIALELVEGRTLAEAVTADGPLDAARVANIAAQVCGSLGEAHALDIVHRDMKPSNVLLTHRGNNLDFVKVVDFGLAKVLNDEAKHEDSTQTGVVMGTPRYMSPEQIQGRDLSAQSDQYSLGAVMYYALTGKAPFDAESKFDILVMHMQQEPKPLAEAYPGIDVPPALEAIVMRCLAKQPEDRFENMEQLSQDLRAIEQDLRRNHSRYDRRSLPRSDNPKAASHAPRERPSRRPITAPAPVSVPQAIESWQLSTIFTSKVLLLGGLLFSLAGGLAGATIYALTAMSAHPTPVHIVTSPAKARLRHGRVDLGDSPATLVVPEGQVWEVDIEAEGFVSRSVRVTAGQDHVNVQLVPAASERSR